MNFSFAKSSPTHIPQTQNTNTYYKYFQGKNLLILILTVVLIFSFLGINLLLVLGNLIQNIFDLIKPIILKLLSLFGFVTGSILGESGEIATATAKTGVDIAGDTIQNVADILKGDTNYVKFDNELNTNNISTTTTEVQADNSNSTIQNSGSANTNNLQWCLVGEYQGKRGCIEVTDTSKCLSGQLFPSHQKCVMPIK